MIIQKCSMTSSDKTNKQQTATVIEPSAIGFVATQLR